MWKCPKCGRSFSREGQSHYCGKIETIDQYIDEQDESVRPCLIEVRQIIREAIPEAKEHLGLYPGGEATTVFADKLESFDVSKGTIRLPYNKPLPKELVAEIAQWCYEQYAK